MKILVLHDEFKELYIVHYTLCPKILVGISNYGLAGAGVGVE
jgi:hypothetical protein